VFSTSVSRLPSQVSKLLLPYEAVVLMTRRHPIAVAGPVAATVAGFLVALVLSATVARSAVPAAAVLWVAWLIVFTWAVWSYADWHRTYFVATENRLLLKTGVVRTRLAMLPLGKVTELLYDQSVTGRTLSFATFTFETAGPDQTMRNITYIPYSDSLYLELMGLIFPDPNEDNGQPANGRMRPGDDPDDD
jgi:membrane protein YdbS with pleckstrin-like domain